MIRMSGVDEAGGLLVVDLFGEMPVKEGVGDVQLMYWPGTRYRKLQDGVNRVRLDDQFESVGEVDTGSLTETMTTQRALYRSRVPSGRVL